MLVYILRRLLVLPVVLFAVSVVIVALLQLLPPTQRAASFITSEQQAQNIDAIVEQFGFNDPFHIQYWRWLKEALNGNLGVSRTSSQPVVETIERRFPATLELTLFAVIPIIFIGIRLGTAAALNRDSFVDQFSRISSIIGWSLPDFVLSIWLLALFYGGLGWFGFGRISNELLTEIAQGTIATPTGLMTIDAIYNQRWDMLWDAILHLVLPVTTLTVVISARLIRVMRSSLLDALSQDYVRTAKAKGLPYKAIYLKHARRNALIPVITLSGLTVAGLLNGTIIVETVFNLDGLGKWAASAATQLDTPAIIGFALVVAIIIVLTNLIVDILYAFIDPRIRYD